MKKKKAPSSASTWLDSATDLPRETQIVHKDRQRQQKFYRRFIVASVILLPISLFANIGLIGNAGSGDGATVVAPAVDSESRAAATMAVRTWLSNGTSPVPGAGTIVSWNDVTRMKRPAQTEKERNANPLPAWNIDVHNFTIADSNGQTYSSDIQVAVDPTTGSHAVSSPSLTPIPVDANFSTSDSPWYGLTVLPAPDSVVTAVKAWSNAYTSGDAASLRQAVGDQNGEHVYVPLGGVVSHSIEVSQAAELPALKEGDLSNTMLVRVQLTVGWAGAAAPTNDDPAAVTSYDLLVDGSNTAAPKVVAWTGPGMGLKAQPFQNALNGRSGSIIIPVKEG